MLSRFTLLHDVQHGEALQHRRFGPLKPGAMLDIPSSMCCFLFLAYVISDELVLDGLGEAHCLIRRRAVDVRLALLRPTRLGTNRRASSTWTRTYPQEATAAQSVRGQQSAHRSLYTIDVVPNLQVQHHVLAVDVDHYHDLSISSASYIPQRLCRIPIRWYRTRLLFPSLQRLVLQASSANYAYVPRAPSESSILPDHWIATFGVQPLDGASSFRAGELTANKQSCGESGNTTLLGQDHTRQQAEVSL
jgi:hypothetical protein